MTTEDGILQNAETFLFYMAWLYAMITYSLEEKMEVRLSRAVTYICGKRRQNVDEVRDDVVVSKRISQLKFGLRIS